MPHRDLVNTTVLGIMIYYIRRIIFMEIFNDQIVQILVNYFDNVKRVKLVVTSGELAIFVPIMDEIVVL